MLLILIIRFIRNPNSRIDEKIKSMEKIQLQHKMLIIGDIGGPITANIKAKARIILDSDPNMFLVYYLPEEEFEAYPRKYKWRYKETLPLVYLTLDHIRSLYKKRKFEALPDHTRHTIFVRLDDVQMAIFRRMQHEAYTLMDASFGGLSVDEDPDETEKQKSVTVIDANWAREQRMKYVYGGAYNTPAKITRIVDLQDKVSNIKEVAKKAVSIVSKKDVELTRHFMAILAGFLAHKYRIVQNEVIMQEKLREELILKRNASRRDSVINGSNMSFVLRSSKNQNQRNKLNTSQNMSNSFYSKSKFGYRRGNTNQSVVESSEKSEHRNTPCKKNPSSIRRPSFRILDDPAIQQLQRDRLQLEDAAGFGSPLLGPHANRHSIFMPIPNPKDQIDELASELFEATDREPDPQQKPAGQLGTSHQGQGGTSLALSEAKELEEIGKDFQKATFNNLSSQKNRSLLHSHDRNNQIADRSIDIETLITKDMPENDLNELFTSMENWDSDFKPLRGFREPKSFSNVVKAVISREQHKRKTTLHPNPLSIHPAVRTPAKDSSALKNHGQMAHMFRSLVRMKKFKLQAGKNREEQQTGEKQVEQLIDNHSLKPVLRPQNSIGLISHNQDIQPKPNGFRILSSKDFTANLNTHLAVKATHKISIPNHSEQTTPHRSTAQKKRSTSMEHVVPDSDTDSNVSKPQEHFVSGVYRELPVDIFPRKIVTCYSSDPLAKKQTDPQIRVIKVQKPGREKLWQLEHTVDRTAVFDHSFASGPIGKGDLRKSLYHHAEEAPLDYNYLLENPQLKKLRRQKREQLKEATKIFVNGQSVYEAKSFQSSEQASNRASGQDQDPGKKQHNDGKSKRSSFLLDGDEEEDSEEERQRKSFILKMKQSKPLKSYAQRYFYGDLKPRSSNFSKVLVEGLRKKPAKETVLGKSPKNGAQTPKENSRASHSKHPSSLSKIPVLDGLDPAKEEGSNPFTPNLARKQKLEEIQMFKEFASRAPDSLDVLQSLNQFAADKSDNSPADGAAANPDASPKDAQLPLRMSTTMAPEPRSPGKRRKATFKKDFFKSQFTAH